MPADSIHSNLANSHPPLFPRQGHGDGLGVADFLPAGEVPLVGEAAALVRLDRVDAAGVAIEHDALVVFLFEERKALAVHAQAGVLIDEVTLAHAKVGGDGADLILLQAHVAGPLAACRAAVTDIECVRVQIGVPVSGAAVGGHQFRA